MAAPILSRLLLPLSRRRHRSPPRPSPKRSSHSPLEPAGGRAAILGIPIFISAATRSLRDPIADITTLWPTWRFPYKQPVRQLLGDVLWRLRNLCLRDKATFANL